ncbi:hypothetical protein PAMP_002540 [Pampus punctatissimus]
MWVKTFLLLLHTVEDCTVLNNSSITLHHVTAVVASQCWQGATFSEAVVSPAVESSSILRVPGVASLPQCVAACCDLPGYDLAWLFEGRCYILSCQQRANCQPRERRGADSVLAFLRRTSPQTLVLQSLVRGEPYNSRWRALSRSSEAPGDLEALKDLALFDGPQQDFSDPGMLDVEYSEGSLEERSEGRGGGGGGAEAEMMTHQPPLTGADKFNQSEVEEGSERRPTESSVAQSRSSSDGILSRGDEDRTRRPTDAAADKTNKTQSSTNSTSAPSLWKPTAAFTQNNHAGISLSTSATPHWTSNTPTQTDQPLVAAFGNPVEWMLPTVKYDASPRPEPTTVSELRGSNRGPVAIVGPDRTMFLPVSSLLLDGSGSTDDRAVTSYHWDTISGPPGLKMESVDQAVATVTGFQAGRYTFRLTVSDQEGATDSTSLTVSIQEAKSLPPVAHASGSHTLILPNNSLVLRGSVTDGDQTQLHYLWVRDNQSPAAGDVLYDSDSQASLYLCNLVEGTYLFQLRVTDARGRVSTATATVQVRPEPGGEEEVELEMLVSVSQVSIAQRDTVVRQLAALLHVLNSDIQVRALHGHSHLSTVLQFSVRGPSGPLSGSRLVGLLRNQLLREKSDYLLFRVLRVDTVLCLLRCSGRGQCDPITKECTCDPFWTENLIRRYLGDGESNCEWRVLYVILTSFILMVFILSVSWTFICCCKSVTTVCLNTLCAAVFRRRQTKVRKKTKYTILDNMDEQERVELRPKFSIKHRSTEHNSSLMMSESELDSDQDTIFSRDRPVRSKNRLSTQAARNGNAFG